MTNKEQADGSMFNAVESVLDVDSAVYEDNDDYVEEVAIFRAAHAINIAAATAAHQDNSGFSLEKLNAKIELGGMASNFAGKAFVKLNRLGKQSIAGTLSYEPTDYLHVADLACATLAQSAHDIMHTNIGDLGSTITAANLTSLQDSINKFNHLQGSSEAVHAVSPDLTKAFKKSYKPVKSSIVNLKLLTRDYKTLNQGFYDRLMSSTLVPTINIHHTYVSIYTVAKTTGEPVEGIVFTLTNGRKSGTSDYEGMTKIDEVKSGKDILTGVIGETVVYTAHIKISKGTTNHYNVVVESL